MPLTDTPSPGAPRIAAVRHAALRRPGVVALIALPLVATALVPATAGEAPLRAVADVKKPKKVEHVEPVYPPEARATGVEGVVAVGFTVDVEGHVTEPIVLRGQALLDEAALAAVRRWRYRPTRVGGKGVCVRMVETVPFWLRRATRPEGWPVGSSAGNATWITWPSGENRPRLELLDLDADELPPPSTLRVYRGTVRNRSGKPLRNVLAVASARDSLNAPPVPVGQEIGSLEPGEERTFELRPGGHQVDVAFGQVVDGKLTPLPTRRQIKSMVRVLSSRPLRRDRTEACLNPECEVETIRPEPSRRNEDEEDHTAAANDFDRPPQGRKITRPEYNKQALEAGVEGTVLVGILIDDRGYVHCARVLRSLPGTGLDAEALQTVYEWRFEPAVKDGQPVPTLAHAPVAFRIY